MRGLSPSFHYWDSVDPAHFLQHDWDNPSRQWATEQAVSHAKGKTLLEVGPGPGVDYERGFRDAVLSGSLHYCGVEGSRTLYDSLRARFPEAAWRNMTIADLRPCSADVVYARHVMEHQPVLEPALSLVLGAARHVVVLTWYRPPWEGPQHSALWHDVPCTTWERDDVLAVIERAGFGAPAVTSFPQDEVWIMERM